MSDLLLTDDELEDLTGYKVWRCQIEWLRRRGWRFETNAAGRPRVARAYFERRMVGEEKTEEPAPRPRHKFEALRVVK